MYLFTKNFYLINIPPLLTIMLCLIIGIIWHTISTFYLIVFAILSGYALFARATQNFLPKQMVLCSLFMYAGAYLHQKNLQDYDDFYTFTHNNAIRVSGTIIDKNEVLTNYKKTTCLTMTINAIATKDCTKTSHKVLMLYCENINNAHVGDAITFENIKIKKPSSESFQRYQIKEQVVAMVFDNAPKYTINHHPTWSLRYWIWNQKKRILDGLESKLSPEGFRFFSSLFLGNRACIKATLEETNEQFKIWGISHFLARSGLHLALFVSIWQAIFCVIPLPMIIKQMIILILSCIYFILTWTSAPFTRSFALFMLNKICLFTNTPFHLLHYLTLVCFGFLLYCPLYLFFLDFQLSFALTFALAWFSQLSNQYESK